MRFHTHIVFGLLCGLITLPYFGADAPLFYLLFVLFGALLPDIDHKESFINKRLYVTKFLPYFADHRGIFHSLLAGIVVLWLGWQILSKNYAIALFTGYLSHLMMDSLTKQGVCYLHPLKMLHIRGPFRTGSVWELLLFVGITVTIMFIAFQ